MFASKYHLQIEYNFLNWKLYMYSLLFIAGNIVFPWIVHQYPLGGPRFLPIYFFVLIAGYKFGWRAGILTAFFSPIANHVLTGMPVLGMLPSIIVRGVSFAILAWSVARITKKISLLNLAIIVIGYQAVGFIFDLVFMGQITNVLIGLPGMAIQVILGYVILSVGSRPVQNSQKSKYL